MSKYIIDIPEHIYRQCKDDIPTIDLLELLMDAVKNSTPLEQEPKTGHWIRVTDKTGHLVWECDKCGWQQRFNTNYCPDCGSDNREVVEE